MSFPHDFHNKKTYLNKLLSSRDFESALSICNDYLQKEDHWFWHFAIASVYFELSKFTQSLKHLKLSLANIEKNNEKIEQIIVKISDIYLLDKKFIDNHNLLIQYLDQNTLYFALAKKLYVSCCLQVNFSDFKKYIKNLESLSKIESSLRTLAQKIEFKNFLLFLIQENELDTVNDALNFPFVNNIFLEDELLLLKGEMHFLMSNYQESKKYLLKITNQPIKNLSYKYLAEIFRVEGDKFTSAKYSFKYLKFFPKDFSIIRTLAYNHKFKKKNHHFLRRCLYLLRSNNKDINLNFAIGKIYEDLKFYDQSIVYFKNANISKKSETTFNKNFINIEIDHYKNSFDSEFYKINKNKGYSKARPIFIVGLPRSGSTIIEEILSRHEDVEALAEIKNFKSNFKYFFNIYDPIDFKKKVSELDNKDFYLIGEKYHNDLKTKLNNLSIFTDKMLFNFAYLPLLKSSFTNCKIIITNRNYKDIFISIYKNYFSDPFFNFAYDEKNIVDMIAIYHNTINHWKKIMGNDLLFVNYSDLVESPDLTFDKIFNFCELKWNSLFLQASKVRRVVDTASSSQVRRSIYKDSLNISDNYQKFFPQAFAELDKLVF